jgi:predicted amidohydrolase
VILATERVVDDKVVATALVINPDGTLAGFQDKVQLDPSEDNLYSPGTGRRVFEVNGVKFAL